MYLLLVNLFATTYLLNKDEKTINLLFLMLLGTEKNQWCMNGEYELMIVK